MADKKKAVQWMMIAGGCSWMLLVTVLIALQPDSTVKGAPPPKEVVTSATNQYVVLGLQEFQIRNGPMLRFAAKLRVSLLG